MLNDINDDIMNNEWLYDDLAEYIYIELIKVKFLGIVQLYSNKSP